MSAGIVIGAVVGVGNRGEVRAQLSVTTVGSICELKIVGKQQCQILTVLLIGSGGSSISGSSGVN